MKKKKKVNAKTLAAKEAHVEFVKRMGFKGLTKEDKKLRKDSFWKNYSADLKKGCMQPLQPKTENWSSNSTSKKQIF